MAEKDIFDKVIDYIDAMSDEEFAALVEECEKNPEFQFAISEGDVSEVQSLGKQD